MDEWPTCETCEDEVNPRRWELGYRTCIRCAEKLPRKQYTAVPMHKSNSVLITDRKQLRYVAVQTPREGLE